jgi:hypothetical protein
MSKKAKKFVNFSKSKDVTTTNSKIKKLTAQKKKIESELKSSIKELSDLDDRKSDYQDLTIKNLNDLHKISTNQYVETYTDIHNKQMELARLHKVSIQHLDDVELEVSQEKIQLLINKINCFIEKLEQDGESTK